MMGTPNFAPSCHATLFHYWQKWNFQFFRVFRAYLREFSIFFHEIHIVARSYQALAADIKSLLIKALVSLETRLKVSILANFWRFLAFFKFSVLAQAFDLGQWFFYKNLVESMYFYEQQMIFSLHKSFSQKLIQSRPDFPKISKNTPALVWPL